MIPTLNEALALVEGGEPLQGLEIDAQQAGDWVGQRYGWKPWCLVRDWAILTVEGLDRPLLFAEHVVYDSAGRFAPGDWVRSSPAVTEPENGVFETRATVYVLQGPGHARKVSPAAILALY